MSFGNGSDQATLAYAIKYNPPMDITVAERNLKEAKQILDQLGVVFLLGSGACLGAVRDNAFIPWDDDIDLFSVLGINGLTEQSPDILAAAFRQKGYFVDDSEDTHSGRRSASKSRVMIKDYVRLSVDCVRIINGNIHAYPGISLPAEMFTSPKEIDFLGEKFLVPNPPEEYLRLKYGTEWMVPKKAGEYEKDVVEQVPDEGPVGRLSRFRVLNRKGQSVPDAEVVLVGCSRAKTDGNGYAKIPVPKQDWYALVIRYPGHEQVLYMEPISPGKTYVYRADSMSDAARSSPGATGTIGQLLLPE